VLVVPGLAAWNKVFAITHIESTILRDLHCA